MEWIILSFLCAIVTSLIIIISKNRMYNYESIEYVSSLRTVVFFYTIPLFIYFIIKNTSINIYEAVLIYVGSLIDTLAYWLTFKSVKYVDIEKISPFFNLEVVFVLLFGYLFFSELPSYIGIIGIVLIFISIIAIQYITEVNFRSFLRNRRLLKYLTIVVLSTLYYAIFKIYARYILYYKTINFFEFVILLNTFNALNTLFLVYVVESTSPLSFFKDLFVWDRYTLIVGLLTFLQIITEYSAYALTTNSAYVSAIKISYVLFNILFYQIMNNIRYSWKIYLISIMSVLGAILIILG